VKKRQRNQRYFDPRKGLIELRATDARTISILGLHQSEPEIWSSPAESRLNRDADGALDSLIRNARAGHMRSKAPSPLRSAGALQRLRLTKGQRAE
jgi:hypothetical protein